MFRFPTSRNGSRHGDSGIGNRMRFFYSQSHYPPRNHGGSIMITDAQGNTLSGASPQAARDYEQAVTAFNLYRGDPMAALERATGAAPDFVMAHLLKVHLMAVATEPAPAEAARGLLPTIAGLPMSERERSHFSAADLILRGEWSAAATALDHHHARHPFDIVALQVGHLCDFFRANARSL